MRAVFFSILHFIVVLILILLIDGIIVVVFNKAIAPFLGWVGSLNTFFIVIILFVGGGVLISILKLLGIPFHLISRAIFYYFPRNMFMVYTSGILLIINLAFILWQMWTNIHYSILSIIIAVALSGWLFSLTWSLFTGVNYIRGKDLK